MTQEIIIAILAGGSAVGIIELVKTLIVTRWNHKHNHVKDVSKNVEVVSKSVDNLHRVMKVILHDRIKYLARSFIKDGFITYDDRRDLLEMHKIYHNELGGNGDLDHLMDGVKKRNCQ